MIRPFQALAFAALSFTGIASAQPPPPPDATLEAAYAQIDALAAEDLATDDLGGIVIGVVVDGELAWSKAYGHADTDGRVPMTTDAVFRIASITKQFTGLMLLQLVEQGRSEERRVG